MQQNEFTVELGATGVTNASLYNKYNHVLWHLTGMFKTVSILPISNPLTAIGCINITHVPRNSNQYPTATLFALRIEGLAI